jgi:hypothetical protein
MSALAEELKPGRNTLDRAPGRALTFLLGAGRSPRLRGLLATRGYTDGEHAGGWQLLRAVDPSMAANDGGASDADPAVRDAVANLDGWDNVNLPIVDAALRRREPEVHGFLFANGLAPADGIESVRVVTTFIDRVDTVRAVAENQRDEPAPFDASQAQRALTLMETRGVGEAEQETVRGWLEVAQRGAAPVAPTEVTTDDEDALVALHEWVGEWALVARKLLKRKVDLIALGLAEKKPRAPKPKDPPQPA